jgi:hypothetical protein
MNNSSFIFHRSSFAAGMTLYAQMDESATLDDVIRQNLEGLVYGGEFSHKRAQKPQKGDCL